MTTKKTLLITAKNLRRIRKKAGLTQSDIGDIIGIDKQAVCKIEAGTRRMQTAEALLLTVALLGHASTNMKGQL